MYSYRNHGKRPESDNMYNIFKISLKKLGEQLVDRNYATSSCKIGLRPIYFYLRERKMLPHI